MQNECGSGLSEFGGWCVFGGTNNAGAENLFCRGWCLQHPIFPTVAIVISFLLQPCRRGEHRSPATSHPWKTSPRRHPSQFKPIPIQSSQANLSSFSKRNIAELRIQKRGAVEGCGRKIAVEGCGRKTAVEGCGRTMFAPTTYLTDTAYLKRRFGGIAPNLPICRKPPNQRQQSQVNYALRITNYEFKKEVPSNDSTSKFKQFCILHFAFCIAPQVHLRITARRVVAPYKHSS